MCSLRDCLCIHLHARLRYLDVAYNNISDMPSNFATMKVLKYLSIGGNNIRYFGEEITSIRALEYLDISHNKLQVRIILQCSFIFW